MTFTRTPAAANSSAATRLIETTPPLLAAYPLAAGTANRAWVEAKLTMEPAPDRESSGSAARMA